MRAKGFTLIELLLAMAISAFVAFVGYQGLRVAIDAAQGVEDEATRLADIQLALGIMEHDISQIIARPIRNELGTLEPVMSGGLANDALLTFTRDGWVNPRMLNRSELARINYQWDGQQLTRQRWHVLDRVSRDAGMDSAILLDGVEDMRVQFYSPFTGAAGETTSGDGTSDGQWVDWWTSERQGLDYMEPLPLAVRISMTITGVGRISRVITIASA
jgi:general secretion pathway protein J